MPSKEELKKDFESKKATLIKELRDWYEDEASSIDEKISEGVPTGTAGSILSVSPPIDSKRVLDAEIVTEEILGIPIPPEIIQPGGYSSCDEMIDDIIPKLEKVYIGELKVRDRDEISVAVGG